MLVLLFSVFFVCDLLGLLDDLLREQAFHQVGIGQFKRRLLFVRHDELNLHEKPTAKAEARDETGNQSRGTLGALPQRREVPRVPSGTPLARWNCMPALRREKRLGN